MLAICVFLIAQSASPPPAITRIYVDFVTNKNPALSLRDALVERLRKEKAVALATSRRDADRVIEGSGETYVKGYHSTNHRLRYRTSGSQPIYGGFLSVELKDKGDEVVWSNLVTPSRLGGADIGKDLANQIVERLMKHLSGTPQGTKTP